MAKNKIPSVDQLEPIEHSQVAMTELHPLKTYQSDGDSYRSREVTVKNLTQVQRDNLKRLVRELEDRGATLSNGSLVTDKSKAVRYLLENAFAQMPS